MEPISTALRELCDMRGISGAELWARAGVSKATLSRYVHGSRGRAPDNRAARTIIKLARVLEVEPDYFLEYRVWRLSRGVVIGAEIVMRYVTPRLLRRLAHRPAPRKPHAHPVDLQTILGQQTRLEESLGRLAVLYSEGQLGEEEYQRARATQRTRLGAVRKRLEQTSWAVERRARALGAEEWDAFTAITSERWAMLPVETQRQICSLLIETVTVHPATADRRIEIRWR